MRNPRLTGAVCWLASAAFSSSTPVRRTVNTTMIYDFKSLAPSTEFLWTSCFDTYQCMMLEVPLDYADPSVGSTNIAFIKIPSQSPDAEDILYNPGGPGLSGIQDFLDAPEALAEAIGTQYNLVTFDPRGVNRSGIDLDCFQGYDGAKYDFYAEVSGSPVDSSSETALRRTYLLNQGWGERCTAVQDPQQPKGYANTVATANDMLHYIGLRAKSLDQPPEQAKLWYYGASYGTILGQTFATLWPERVDRMVLDGVVDADDYFAGGWLTVLADMDASLRQFFADCLTAGSELCPFAGTSSTVQELETRYHALVEGLNRDPILVDQFLTATPVTVNGQNLKRTTLNSLYHPGLYPAFALNLYELETHRNGSLLADAVGYLLLRVPPPPVLEGERLFFAAESTAQIPCNDQVGRFNLSTFDSFKDLVQTQYNTSFVGGELWASSFTTTCVKYGIRPPQSQIFDGPTGSDNTPPILFISNTLDPVAPLRSAKKQATLFSGSTVLEVNGTAHCGYTLPSQCLSAHVQAYFADMTLPPAGALCDPKPAVKPFYVPTE